jgi:hypothetical protein
MYENLAVDIKVAIGMNVVRELVCMKKIIIRQAELVDSRRIALLPI